MSRKLSFILVLALMALAVSGVSAQNDLIPIRLQLQWGDWPGLARRLRSTTTTPPLQRGFVSERCS